MCTPFEKAGVKVYDLHMYENVGNYRWPLQHVHVVVETRRSSISQCGWGKGGQCGPVVKAGSIHVCSPDLTPSADREKR